MGILLHQTLEDAIGHRGEASHGHTKPTKCMREEGDSICEDSVEAGVLGNRQSSINGRKQGKAPLQGEDDGVGNNTIIETRRLRERGVRLSVWGPGRAGHYGDS